MHCYVERLCARKIDGGSAALDDERQYGVKFDVYTSMTALGGSSVAERAARADVASSGCGELRHEECVAWSASWTWSHANYSGVRILHTTSWHPAEGVWRGPPFGSIGHLVDVANLARSDSRLRQPRGRGGVERFGGLRILRFILRTPAHTVRRTLNCLRYHSTL